MSPESLVSHMKIPRKDNYIFSKTKLPSIPIVVPFLECLQFPLEEFSGTPSHEKTSQECPKILQPMKIIKKCKF